MRRHLSRQRLLLLLLLQPFYGPWTFSGTTRERQYQKSKTKKENQSGFTGARESEWQWHQMGDMQICTSPQADNPIRQRITKTPSKHVDIS